MIDVGRRIKASVSNIESLALYFWNLPLSTVLRGDFEGDSGFPAAAGVSEGFLPLRRPLRRREGGESPDLRSGVVNRGSCGGAAEAGWPASSLCSSVASPPWRRPRRRSQAAGASPSCRCFFRHRWQAGDEWAGGRRRRCEAAAAWWCGVKVVDLATSGEVVRRRPGSRAEGAWGVPPADGRPPLLDLAPRSWWLMRLFNAFGLGALLLHGCELRAAAFSLVSGDGGRSSWSSSWLKTACCSSDDLCILLVLIFACIRLCNPPFYL